MSVLAIIPARGGSKRIPKKNIKDFLGKPIISYSIEAAIEAQVFDEIMVSTDDEEIAEIALKYGAKVPFKRSNENASDFATTMDVLAEVYNSYLSNGANFEYACCIYPTAPFVSSTKLIDAFEKLKKGNYDSVFPIQKFSYPIFRALKNENDKIALLFPEFENKRSQDIPDAFHDAGQFYFFKTSILENKTIFTNNSCGITIDELEGQDIDNLSDWKIAEIKYQLLKNS
ncbi:pseudaminic acid cytidylyltransferase [Solitalea longa]|uniref:Pseudaminic acid cytidylyltransferase n=1 Tax=Solitalea longa TaxID=2079460 RepID=A0A2S5AA50_9SPHI|nr:pseudaminic acid cytidylyltransferase [Solitalea longa]POY39117.1 pseudaminic acid cytidylyltransferase [Solitalea longa]